MTISETILLPTLIQYTFNQFVLKNENWQTYISFLGRILFHVRDFVDLNPFQNILLSSSKPKTASRLAIDIILVRLLKCRLNKVHK